MSGPEPDDKGFLARWSQRKQEARQPEAKPPETKPEPQAAADAAAPEQKGETAEAFDLSTLPKLEDITGTTDISAFLRKGVPESIRNAALRKSWALDPAVRNYVSPALDYAYDWNTPGGVPGGGELSAGYDVAKMVSQIMGDGPRDESATPVEPGSAQESSTEHVAARKNDEALPSQSLRRSDEAVSSAEDDGSTAGQGQESGTTETAAPQTPVRRHGSAKPTV